MINGNNTAFVKLNTKQWTEHVQAQNISLIRHLNDSCVFYNLFRIDKPLRVKYLTSSLRPRLTISSHLLHQKLIPPYHCLHQRDLSRTDYLVDLPICWNHFNLRILEFISSKECRIIRCCHITNHVFGHSDGCFCLGSVCVVVGCGGGGGGDKLNCLWFDKIAC